MLWKDVRPQTKLRIRTQRPLAEAELRVLSHLYLPIIQTPAHSLYVYMFHQLSPDLWRSGVFTHRRLMDCLGLHLNEIVAARERLEGIGLLSTYRFTEDDGYEYVILPPLTPYQFFQSDILSLSLLNRVGKSSYREIREHFSIPPDIRFQDLSEKREVTKGFSEVYREIQLSEVTVTPQSETEAFINDVEEKSPLPTIDSDYQSSIPEIKLDFEYLEALFPREVRPILFTQDNRRLIERYHFLYGIELEHMGTLLRDTFLMHKQQWDINRFEELAKRLFLLQKKEAPLPNVNDGIIERPSNKEEHLKNLKAISPYQLLRNYQNGGKVSQPDENLIHYLLNDLDLKEEVVNVLIDYVLLAYDNKLPRAITEKIAGSWKRKGFTTAEEAFQFAQEEYAKQMAGPGRRATTFKSKSSAKKREAKKQVPDYIWLQVERDRKLEGAEREAQGKEKVDVEHVRKMIEELEGKD